MKFHSKAVEEHGEAPLADDGRLEQLVGHWQGRATTHTTEAGNNRCYVLSVLRPDDGDVVEARLAEIIGLVDAQGDSVVGSDSYVLHKPDARTLIRRGVAERIAESARRVDASMLVVDAELSPSQTRNLEDVVGLPICDREAVILNVFERNAATRRARAQVEIAHLQYLRPRIRGIGLNMDQQMGGSNKARGPGETASELLARQLDGRLAELRRRLEHLERSDASGRKHRANTSRVVLVGYTNAGKTSLMNALTQAGLSAKDRPFETLDTTSRRLSSHGGDVLLSDSVGFIRRLPERLFASFESTLAEVSEASLLLLVTDVSDREAAAHLETTRQVLRRLGAADIPRLVVFNKVDRLGSGEANLAGLARGNKADRLVPGEPDLAELAGGNEVDPLGSRELKLAELAGGDAHLAVSAHDADSVERLREEILRRVRAQRSVRQLFVPYTHNGVIRDIYGRCRVLETEATPDGMRFVVEGEPHVLDALTRALESH